MKASHDMDLEICCTFHMDYFLSLIMISYWFYLGFFEQSLLLDYLMMLID